VPTDASLSPTLAPPPPTAEGTESQWLLASAIAGRRMAVLAARGGRSHADGAAVHIALDPGADVRTEVVIQAALVAGGGLERRFTSQLAGRRRARRRYLALEVIRSIEELAAVVPPDVLAAVRAVDAGPVSEGPEQSLARALDGSGLPLAPAWFGEIRGALPDAEPPGPPGWLPAMEADEDDPEEDEDDEDEAPDRSRLMELMAVTLPSNPITRLMAEILGSGRHSSGGEGGAELDVAGTRWGRPGRGERRGDGPPADDDAVRPGPSAVQWWYPEFDRLRGEYRANWCCVGEYDPDVSTDSQAPGPGPPRRDVPLGRELARLRGVRVRRRRTPDGDDIDVGALVDAVVRRRMGASPDERVHESRRDAPHGLSVLLLLDASGSTGETADDLRVFDAQVDVVRRLLGELDRLGNRTAAFAFQSYGRHDVRFLRVKDFDGRLDRDADRRLAALTPAGFTRLGAAVRHGAHLLETRGHTERRALILVGDGLPFDTDYRDQDAYTDSRRALAEASAAGIGCACISVGAGTAPEISDAVWGGVPHVALEHQRQLTRHVRPLLAQALACATATRRTL
jgi:nitric oxide reductase NorD protein